MRLRCRLLIACLLCLITLPVAAEAYVAGSAAWKPYAFEDDKGRLRGLAVDITRRVMQLAHVNAIFVTYPVNRLQSMLQKGEIDLNYADALIWNSPEERQHYVFSKPYSVVSEHLYFLADNPASGQPIEQLDHLTIGTVRGYTYATLDPSLEMHRFERLETSQDDALIKLLQSRRVDAIAMVDDIFDGLISTSRLDPAQFRRGAKLSEAPLVIKLQPEHAQWLGQINQAIDTLRSTGELESIRRRYLPGSNALACAEAIKGC
jgi:ABC-type amino acid transport substrate-binding protein